MENTDRNNDEKIMEIRKTVRNKTRTDRKDKGHDSRDKSMKIMITMNGDDENESND